MRQAQLQQGLPIQTGEDLLPSTKFVKVSSAAAIPTADYFSRAPYLKWTGCVSGGGPSLSDARPPSAPIDLELNATIRLQPNQQLFADVSQGTVNMCTSMAFAQAYTLAYVLQTPAQAFAVPKATVPQLSAVFAYYFQRVEECTVSKVCVCTTCSGDTTCTDVCNPPCVDCGSYLLSAATVFANGVCVAEAWPYSKAAADLNTYPDEGARMNALAYRVTEVTCLAPDPASIQTSMKQTLAAGAPLVVFLTLTTAQAAWMEAAKFPTTTTVTDLVMPLPKPGDPFTIGHALMVDGWVSGLFIARNNFGTSWGFGGRCCIPGPVFQTQVHSIIAVAAVCGPDPGNVGPGPRVPTRCGASA